MTSASLVVDGRLQCGGYDALPNSAVETASADHDVLPLSVVSSTLDYEELGGTSVSVNDVVVVDSGDAEDDFDRVACEAVVALESGIHAELITAGSSGSYYIRDRQKVTNDNDNNKCIGDDTKAAARQSLNCIKNKK